MVTSVTYIDEHSKYKTELADKIILATGGKSYPLTGSTGDGYKIAEELGHTIKPVKPSLVPLTARGESLQMCKNMQGLSLKNVGIELEDEEKEKDNIQRLWRNAIYTFWSIWANNIKLFCTSTSLQKHR